MKKRRFSHERQSPPPSESLQRSWTPFVLCGADPRGDEILIYRNSRYQVHVRRIHATNGSPDLIHLSMKRLDQLPHIPYRDRMRIKDELWGPEYEAVELLPARSREIDVANQVHLWLVDSPFYRFPFGFSEGRYVSDLSLDGAVQEPWPTDERPDDCLSEEALRDLLRRAWNNPVCAGNNPYLFGDRKSFSARKEQPMKADAMQPTSSPNEALLPQEPRYMGTVEVELTGLALMHQRRPLHLAEPLGRSEVETLALAAERQHVWDYQGMQEDSIRVVILSKPHVLPENALPGTTGPIIARLFPDGCPGITFDASFWLRQADVQDLRVLRETDFAGNYFSDELAYAAREHSPPGRGSAGILRGLELWVYVYVANPGNRSVASSVSPW